MKFRWWYPIRVQPDSYLFPVIGMRNPWSAPLPPLPFGWRWLREQDRSAATPLPLWLYWPLLAWRYRWWVLAPLRRLGIVKVADGDYWSNARPWFWNAERERSWRAMLKGLPDQSP